MNKKKIVLISLVLVVALMSVLLVACNAENYESKLKNKSYDVKAFGLDDPSVIAFNNAISGTYKEGIEWKIVASNAIDTVTIFKFNNTKDAKAFAQSDYCYTFGSFVDRSTTCVFVGTEQGVKDAK